MCSLASLCRLGDGLNPFNPANDLIILDFALFIHLVAPLLVLMLRVWLVPCACV